MSTLKITSAFLLNRDACEEYLSTFEKLFPEGVEVTEELAARHAEDFDWFWAIRVLLTTANWLKAKKLFDAEDNELDDAIAAAKSRAEAAGWSPEATRVYYRERDDLDSAYEIECARIFARLFIEQGGRPLLESEAS